MKKSDLEVLRALSRGESVGGGRLKGELLQRLRDEHLIIASQHGSRMSYRQVEPGAIEKIFNLLDPSFCSTRAELVELFGDSKYVSIRTCPGFPVNVYDEMEVEIGMGCNGIGRQKIRLRPMRGAFTYISDWQNFRIPENAVVVGVENMENFRLVEEQRYLFEKLGYPVLFASRYPQSGDFVRWLMSIPNRYIHFGDFDLAGIHIYLSEFRKWLNPSRCSYFIPQDIELRLSRGSRERYDKQIKRFGSLSSDDPQLMFLINLIHKYRRAYDQEGFIRFPVDIVDSIKASEMSKMN